MKGSNTRAVHPEIAKIMREMQRIGIESPFSDNPR